MDQVRQFLASAAVFLPFHSKQGPFAVQYRLVITESRLEPIFRQVESSLGIVHPGSELLFPFLCLDDASHGVLDFSRCL